MGIFNFTRTVVSGVGRAVSAPGHRRLRRLGPLGAIGALSLVLSGCLSSGYTYLSHQSPDGTALYFKVPGTWTRFGSSSDVKATNGQLSISQISQVLGTQIQGAQWYESFNASPHAKPGLFINDLGSKYPEGIAFTAQLNPSLRDAFSLAGLRSEVLGTDPLAPAQNSPFNVLAYNEFTKKGGIRGSKLVTDINDGAGITVTYAQIVEVDPATNYVSAIAVGCRASCWGPNQGTINQILNTWNVKELRP
jgi:hypothetical protein